MCGLYGNLASFSLSRFLDRHFGFLWGFPLTTRSQTSVPLSPFPAPCSLLPAPRSPFPVLVTSPELDMRILQRLALNFQIARIFFLYLLPQNCPFPLPFLTVIAFHRAKKNLR